MTCGAGSKSRDYICTIGNAVVDLGSCDLAGAPTITMDCHLPDCPAGNLMRGSMSGFPNYIRMSYSPTRGGFFFRHSPVFSG